MAAISRGATCTNVSQAPVRAQRQWSPLGATPVPANPVRQPHLALSHTATSPRSSSAGDKRQRLRAVSQPEPVTDNLKIPSEMARLSKLVKDGYASSDEIKQLKKNFQELTEDLKKQIEAVAASTNPSGSSSLASNAPGRRRLTPATGSEEFRASSVGLSDLDGLILHPQRFANQNVQGEEGEESRELTIPRSEVIAMRSRLNKKLSESNTYNRFLMREIQYREDAIRETKHVLVALVSEMKDILAAIDELASAESFLPRGTVDPTSLPSSLQKKFQELLQDLVRQLQGVEAMKLREVPLVWIGMAEDVKVMGSFDGWTYGEQMSPEYTGTATQFSTVLKLRPGRYEIKFVVDGDWRVAPQWPTVGQGMTENNVLVVD